MDRGSIIREWFYRLPNGYANAPYTNEEMDVLHAILEEEGINGSIFVNEVDQLDQAFIDAKPVQDLEEAVGDEEFIPVLIDILSTQIRLQRKLVDLTINEYKLLSLTEKDAFQKSFRKLSIKQFINNGYKPFLKFFDILGDVKGLGRGEIQILLGVQDSRTGGTAQHDIVMPNGEYEVKELTKMGDFDPAKAGDVNSHNNLTMPIRDFYDNIIRPYEIFQEKGDFVDSLKALFDEKVHDKVDELIDILNQYFTFKKGRSSNSAAQVGNFREISQVPFENMYRGFKALNKLFESPFDDDIKDTRLSLKGDSTGTYWVSDEDAQKIQNAAGEDEPISIDVGEPIDNESNELVIWVKRLERSEFVRTPQVMADSGKEVVDKFFGGVIGVIYYTQGSPIPKLASPEQFAIQKVSRGMYRIAFKLMQDETKYTFVKDQ